VIQAIRSFLDERWQRLRPGAARLVDGIVLGADRDPEAHVTMVFLDGTGSPGAVAKVSREFGGEAALQVEHFILSQLAVVGSPWVRTQVPEVLGLHRVGRRLVLVTSPLPGRPMRTAYYSPGHVADPRRVREDFARAGSWLARFHRETTFATPTFGDGAFDLWVQGVLDRYRREIGWGPEEDEVFTEVRGRALDLYGTRLPLVVSHGDFTIGNVMVADGRLCGLIDWERGELARPPFRDIYKFPTSYAMYLDRAAPRPGGGALGHPEREPIAAAWRRHSAWPNLPGIGYAYFGSGWFPELVRRHVLGALDRLEIPHAANAVFFPLFLAEEAMSIPDPAFRAGYRSAVRALADQVGSTWLWKAEVSA